MLSLLGLKGPMPSLLMLLGLVTLILCNFSVPFLASIKIFRVRVFATNGLHVVDYGLWGYCVPTLKYCTSPGLGFVIDNSVAAALSMPGIQDALDSKHTTALIMYPIAVGATLFTLICTIVLMLSKRGHCTGSWGCFPMTFRYARSLLAGYSLSFLTSILALIVEISIVTKFKSRMDDFRFSNVSLVWGNVIWLTAIAVATNLYCYILVWWLRKEAQDGVYCPQISKPHMQGPSSPQFTPQSPQSPQSPHPPPPPAASQTFHNVLPQTSQSFHNPPHQASQTFHALHPQGSQSFHNAQPFPNYSHHPPEGGSFNPPPPPPPEPQPQTPHSGFNPYAFHQPGYTGKEGSVHLAPPAHNPHEQDTSTPTLATFPSNPGNPAYPQQEYPGYSSHAPRHSNYSGYRQ